MPRGRSRSPGSAADAGAEIPSFGVANSKQAWNQTVSGVRVLSKIVPAVTEVRRPQPPHSIRPWACRRHDRNAGRQTRPASEATPGSQGNPRRRGTTPGTHQSSAGSAHRPGGNPPDSLLRLTAYHGCRKRSLQPVVADWRVAGRPGSTAPCAICPGHGPRGYSLWLTSVSVPPASARGRRRGHPEADLMSNQVTM